MATKMTSDQWRAFVSEGTRTGKLATVRADGAPHVVPVWFVLDGDDVVFNTGKTSVKGRNLARDARASICVDDERPPYSFVALHGRVTISEDLADMRTWSTAIASRYMGERAGTEFGERNAVPGELLVRLQIEGVIAVADMTD